MLHALDLMGFCVSAGAACHGGSQSVSGTLTSIGFTQADAACSLRISLGRHTTREEVLRFADAVDKLLRMN
jgi:cysteine desulfurase